jgi:hypothetical protein
MAVAGRRRVKIKRRDSLALVITGAAISHSCFILGEVGDPSCLPAGFQPRRQEATPHAHPRLPGRRRIGTTRRKPPAAEPVGRPLALLTGIAAKPAPAAQCRCLAVGLARSTGCRVPTEHPQ